MPPCHIDRYLTAAGARDSTAAAGEGIAHEESTCELISAESCDYCGSAHLEWRKCKLVCADCRQINKSCADL